jgi:serine/threonine protein kinase
MGEVYRARDTRLNRSVAVKILPAEFAQNAQLRLRFEREAKTISQLSHPNICTLYDVGDNYLVMELLDGESLADRLLRGSVPLGEALRIAIQIADALDRAHRQSIVHRDLKPGNIMLTRGGAKLLDFGLARAGNVVLTGAPADATQQKPITQEGTIVGTFNYMAPEQLEGEEADERTDIFAFGAVLYEMVTGKRAFTGSTRTSLIAAIVSGEPRPLSELQPVAASVERLVARCLAKDPDARWQCAADLKWELNRIEEEVNHPATATRRKRSYVAASIAAAIALLFAALFVAERARRPRPEPPLRFAVSPPNGWIFPVGNNIGPPAFAPDGRKFAVVGVDLSSGKSMLWIRDLAETEPKLLAGTEGASFPFWSPDSNSVGFFAGERLNRIDVTGGSPQTLCAVSFPRGGTWSSNGEIIFCPSPSDSLLAIPANGGVPHPLTTLDAKQKESSHRWPSMLPDGRHYLFMVRKPSAIGDVICVGSIDSREKKLLMTVSSNAMYAEPGYILFVRNRTLYARRFDLRTISFTAAEIPIAHAIQTHGSGFALFSAARDVLVFEGGTLASSLEVIGRDGRLQGTLGEPGDIFSVNITSDGQHVVYSLLDPVTGASDIWLYDRQRRVARRQTFGPANDFYAVVSPDQSELIFASNRAGIPDIYAKPIDGAEERLLLQSNFAKFPQSISSDGRFLLYRQVLTQGDIWVLPLKGGKPFPFATSPFNEIQPTFSPSGRWVAYASNESGRYEVYVARFPSGSGRVQISPDGGRQPTWRGDEKELYYVGPQERLFAVSIEAGSTLKAGIPTAIMSFELRPSRDEERQYDVTSDGKSFIVNSLVGPSHSLPMTVVQHWQPNRQ